jgi:hypothetical protein
LPLPTLESAVAPALFPKGGMCVAADIARNHWHTYQHIFYSANIQAGQISTAGRVEEHWNSVVLHDRVGRQFDGLKGAEEDKGELCMSCFVLHKDTGARLSSLGTSTTTSSRSQSRRSTASAPSRPIMAQSCWICGSWAPIRVPTECALRSRWQFWS